MSSVKELEEKVKELMDELEKLKQEEIVTFEYPFEDREEYFCLHIDGEIIPNLWSGGPFDEGVYKQGHAFKNREEARKERDKREMLMRFNQFRDKCNGDWKPDFTDLSQDKYTIRCDYGSKQLFLYGVNRIYEIDLFGFFKNSKDCERAIDLFGDEIIRLWVEEK